MVVADRNAGSVVCIKNPHILPLSKTGLFTQQRSHLISKSSDTAFANVQKRLLEDKGTQKHIR